MRLSFLNVIVYTQKLPSLTGMCPIMIWEAFYFGFESLDEKNSYKDQSIIELTVKRLIFMYRLMLSKIKQNKICKSFFFGQEIFIWA